VQCMCHFELQVYIFKIALFVVWCSSHVYWPI